jgi:HD-GYP domain-containing protein (c-di-GMP phosphodiesterase class II)
MDLLLAVSSAADLVSPAVSNHHKRVAYLAGRIAAEHGLPLSEIQSIVTAAAVHDIGVFRAREREELQEFELAPEQRHAELGYRLLAELKPIAPAARLVRYHHTRWDGGAGVMVRGEDVPLGSHIIHLADRIDVLISGREFVLSQVPRIREKITDCCDEFFQPQLVETFNRLAQREYFWLDARSPRIDDLLRREFNLPVWELSLPEMHQLAVLMSRIIDYKSPFTSTHTAGVATTSAILAGLLPYCEEEREMIAVAGYLHDLGKLAVPAEILEKPAPLTTAEFDVMRSHTYHTRRILETVPGLETIADWAAGHHERLDGTGYPFHLSDLSQGARIIAVADVFTAISEDRPYRAGMDRQRVAQVMQNMASNNQLDEQLVGILLENFDSINAGRQAAQAKAARRYAQITAPAA